MDITQFISDNYQWIFSGIGVAIFSGLAGFFICKKSTRDINKVTQKDIHAGGDVVGRDKNDG